MVTPSYTSEEEVENAVWGLVKYETRTTRGSYEDGFTEYSEISEQLLPRATRMAPNGRRRGQMMVWGKGGYLRTLEGLLVHPFLGGGYGR
jgi:hypothetical protein